ncbi:MAG: hypothetical protein ACXVZU_02735 [Methanobacteriaceae archaeon]
MVHLVHVTSGMIIILIVVMVAMGYYSLLACEMVSNGTATNPPDLPVLQLLRYG